MLKRRQTSSLKITKRCSVGCQEYWDNVLQYNMKLRRKERKKKVCQIDRGKVVKP